MVSRLATVVNEPPPSEPSGGIEAWRRETSCGPDLEPQLFDLKPHFFETDFGMLGFTLLPSPS